MNTATVTPHPMDTLRLGEVAKRLGVSVATVRRLRQNPEAHFPSDVRLTRAAKGVLRGELEAWLESRKQKRTFSGCGMTPLA